MVKKLQWDSDFFNLKVGEIRDNKEPTNQVDFDLIYLISTEDIQLKIKGFENTFSETKVVFVKDLVEKHQISNFIFKLDEVKINIENLYLLAFESGKNSRFLLDKRIEEEVFKKLYRTWIDNSIYKKFADDIFVYFEENQLKGFVTYKTNEAIASIGLIAVNPIYQGKGIGAKLLKYLENNCLKNGVKQITIPTQSSNIDACIFYEKQGYSIKNKTFIKHYWKK